MPANLYEILGVSPSAAPEDVRKAYRRKALETHPDRLPQGASAAEKSASEDLFRKINNAYEVLSNPQSRAEYDRHGVWPPPAQAPQGPFANGHEPFSDPFFRDPFFRDPFSRGHRMDPFGGFGFGPQFGTRGFTDPFVLFNSIFGDLHRAFGADPFFDNPFGRRGFQSDTFGGGFFNNHFRPMFPSPFDLSRGIESSRFQASSNGGNGGGWVSESWTSSTVNGVTHRKSVRRDAQGNEHVTYRYPDGTERRTINGIEQSTYPPPRALLPSAPPAQPVAYPTQVADVPPPTYSEAAAQSPRRSRSSRHHHHSAHPGDTHEHRDRHRQEYPPPGGYREDKQGRDPNGGESWDFRRS